MLFAVPRLSCTKIDKPDYIPHDSPDFSLSLTTETVWRNNIAGMVTSTLRDRFSLSDSIKIDIETCLHEALINAVIHGNLCLENHIKSLEDFESYYAGIEERISKASYKNRRINITVWNHREYLEITVNDEGKGFAADVNFAEHTFPYGRGLFIIHSLADSVSIADDRRTLCMAFKR